MTKNPITILFSANNKYAMLLGTVLCSIFENKGDYPIHVFVMDLGISETNKERLEELEKKYGFSIIYLAPHLRPFENVLTTPFPKEVYYRMLVGSFLASYHRVLYLDVDTVVRGDIAELFNYDLGGKTIGAVADCFQRERREHLQKLLESTEDFMYFNSGVILIDLDLWREHGIEEKLLAVVRKSPEKLYFADQDALNIVLAGDCKELPLKYNFIAAALETEGAYQEHTVYNPFIIHFAAGGKPWYYFSSLPYQREYLHYVEKTPWKQVKYRKPMDIYFAKQYKIYPLMWAIWSFYKKVKKMLKSMLK